MDGAHDRCYHSYRKPGLLHCSDIVMLLRPAVGSLPCRALPFYLLLHASSPLSM